MLVSFYKDDIVILPTNQDQLLPDEVIGLDQSITSLNGRYTFIYQGDGNLVVYRNSDGRPLWASNTHGRPAGVCIMQGDGNLVIYGPDGEYIWDTATHGQPGNRIVVQDDGNVVIYRPDGVASWATNTNIIRGSVSGFILGISWFRFYNSFPSVPHFVIDILGIKIPIGDASNGLCGGMVFAVRDFFESGISIPSDSAPPSTGQIYDFLVKRLYDSFNLPLGPTKYMGLMNPTLPDHETEFSKIGLAPHGRAWVMIMEEWPKIKMDLDNNRLCPLGLVTIKSLDPLQMGLNHQVLAYGYELDGPDLIILVYDPNHPMDTRITISLNVSNPANTTPVAYSGSLRGDGVIWCFFRPDYTFSSPPQT